MLNKLSKDDIRVRKTSSDYVEFEELDDFMEIDSDIVMESGLTFVDKENNVTEMYKTDSVSETVLTMKKVIAVCDLGEDEIKKFDKVRHIVRGFLDICFRKKFSVFALSMAFIYMFGMGIKERIWFICLMYTWGFLTITETGKALRFVRDTIEEYKIREEALVDNDVMNLLDRTLEDDTEDIRLYMVKKSK